MFFGKLFSEGRDSKKTLTDDEKKEVAEMARKFLTQCNASFAASLQKEGAENFFKIF